MNRQGILCVLLPYVAVCVAVDCSCLIYTECIAYVYEQSPKPTIDCSLLSHFERHHRSSLCQPGKYYHCAFDLELDVYAEICAQTIDIYPGFRPTRELGLNQDHCTEQRYQPFFIQSNLTNHCIYEKSVCNEEGQKIYNNGTSKDDRFCFCNFEEGYAFLVQTLNTFYCAPSTEDCTCYKKKCPDESQVLDRNYQCIPRHGLQLGLVDSYRQFYAHYRPPFGFNSAYKDTAYNKQFDLDFRRMSIWISVPLLVIYIAASLLMLLIYPLSLTIESNVISYLEDTDVTIELTVHGTSIFTEIRMIRVKDNTYNETYSMSEDSQTVIFQIKNAQKCDEGEYRCEITNILGRSSELKITLAYQKGLTVLEEWELKESTKIVTTDAMEKTKKILTENNCVTIIGHSGSGKSTIMRHVALELKKRENYVIYVAFSPEEIVNCFDDTKQQIFVFDDVFGKFAINLHIVDEWVFLMPKIKKLLKSGKLKIILTCRTHIVDHEQFKKLKWLTTNTCNVSHYPLDVKTMGAIARKYLDPETVEITELESMKTYDLFPLYCETFCNLMAMNAIAGDKNIRRFLKQPFEVLREIFVETKENEKLTYALRALFVIYNNEIEKRMFESKHFKDKCRVVTHVCGIKNLTSTELRSHFAKQKYFTKLSGTKYKIFHDKIFDAVVSFYGEEMFDVILEFAHCDIIRERFHFESLQVEKEPKYLISVPKDKEEMYFRRLFIDTNKEILNNEITFTAFGNRQLQYENYRTKFIEYCNKNDELIQQILLFSFKATSPLLEVAAHGYHDILAMLIKMELNVNVSDERGDTPLHKASELGNLETVNLLLNSGADPNRLNKSGESPLFKASQNGHFEIVERLVSCVDVNLVNNLGETPLYVASRDGYLDLARFLIQNGAKPTTFNEYIGSPLHIASQENHIEIIKLLLEKGAVIDLSTHHIEAPLFIASREGNSEAVKVLINKGADPNKCGIDGRSPLCKAAWNGHRNAVELLLGYGADPNIKSEYDETPLYKAARCGHMDIIRMLIENKADVNICCRDGRSPLYKAAWQNKTEVVKTLLLHNADTNISSKYFGSPLYRAAKEGHYDAVEILLSNKKTNIDLQSKDNETALYAAAKFGHIEIVKLLVTNKANACVRNQDGKSPLDAATFMGQEQVFDFLHKHVQNTYVNDS